MSASGEVAGAGMPSGAVTVPVMFGLDWRTAPLSLRERLQLGHAADVEAFLRELAQPAVVLATCHRVEVYVDRPDALGRVTEALARRGQLRVAALQAHGVERQGEACVRHLFEVAAGLRSAVVGEPQILGQVKDALEIARRVRSPGHVLSALFERAIHAGKRVRTETMTGRTSPSLAREAVRRAVEGGVELGQARVLIVGSGEMAMLAAREAVAAGARAIAFCARRPDYARQAAEAVLERRTEGPAVVIEVAPLSDLREQLQRADLVISCTSAPGTVIDAASLIEAVERRKASAIPLPLWVIDLAVPRDVEVPDPVPEGLRLIGVDDVARPAGVSRADVPGAEELAAAMAIVGQEAAAYLEWLRQRQAAPALVAMRRRAEAVRAEELEWALRRLDGHLTPRDREILEAMTRRLANKLLHLPTVFLKEVAAGEPEVKAG